MITLSHPTGNQNVRQALQAFDESGKLESFHTGLGFHQDAFIYKTPLGKGNLARRKYSLSTDKLHSHPFHESMRLLLQKWPNHPWSAHETGAFCIDNIYRRLDEKVAHYISKNDEENNITRVYAYEDGALETFKAASRLGIKTTYELPIAYGRFAQTLLTEEAERLPHWKHTLVGTEDSSAKLDRKEQECTLADTIICPSEFVKASLPAHRTKNKKVHIVPYGCEPVANTVDRAENSTAPLKVLFVGSLTQRKGLADVFEAMRRLSSKHIELHVLGSAIAPLEFYKKEYASFHYYPPRAREEVLELMQACDVFILPSLIEGRALVQLEALSCGLPLIITPNTGGDDLIDEGKTGFQIPIRAPEAIAEKLEWFINNRSQLPKMRKHCVAKATATSWQHYRAQLIQALRL